MKFDEVLKDLAGRAIDEANERFLVQHAGHNFAPFTVERQVITDGGSAFKITLEFEPDPMEALMRAESADLAELRDALHRRLFDQDGYSSIRLERGCLILTFNLQSFEVRPLANEADRQTLDAETDAAFDQFLRIDPDVQTVLREKALARKAWDEICKETAIGGDRTSVDIIAEAIEEAVIEYARVHQPEQNLEDKNSVLPKPKALSHSTSTASKDIQLTLAEIRERQSSLKSFRRMDVPDLLNAARADIRTLLSIIDTLQRGDGFVSTTEESPSPASPSESESTLVTVDEVSKALEELRVMFPNTWIFVADRATWTQGCESPTRSAVIEIERKENAFFGTTLSEAIKRVRVSKEQDNAKS